MKRRTRIGIIIATLGALLAGATVTALHASADEFPPGSFHDVSASIAPNEAGHYAYRVSWHGCKGVASFGQILYTSGAIRAYAKFVPAEGQDMAKCFPPFTITADGSVQIDGVQPAVVVEGQRDDGRAIRNGATATVRPDGTVTDLTSDDPNDPPNWATISGRLVYAVVAVCSSRSAEDWCHHVIFTNTWR